VVNGRQRAPILPTVPTAGEAGFPALEVEGLVGLFGPKGMSNALREKIAADVVAATNDPTMSARLSATAQMVNPGGASEFTASIDHQRAQIAKIAHELGIRSKQ
jgi:tripartite-type tricarboxylate transporter receptor subunit TctC